MNKQELIEKIKDISLGAGDHGDTKNEHESEYALIDYILDLVNRLDEPQKAKVPERVGKDLDTFTKARLKEDLVKDICLAVYDYSQGTPFDTATVNWCRKGSNLRTMIDAIWNGYEVEEEPKYRVKIGNGYFVNYQGRGCLISPHEKDGIMNFDSMKEANRTADTVGGTVEKV
ncbi:DUF1642 domain-containing protein [Enterococcus gilvus]|uniref:DUF1642 domain-containing protein n=1 Tax=Enterococcus gilvus TaxID=160453 RepID=UPI003EDAD8B7